MIRGREGITIIMIMIVVIFGPFGARVVGMNGVGERRGPDVCVGGKGRVVGWAGSRERRGGRGKGGSFVVD